MLAQPDQPMQPREGVRLFGNRQQNRQENAFERVQSPDSKPSSKDSKFNCRDGPTSKKVATDCQCTVIYFVLTALLIVLIILFQNHSIHGFQNPFNHHHQPCLSNQSLLSLPSHPTICVKNCPTKPGAVLKCDESVPADQCPHSIQNLKYSQQLSLCYRYQFSKGDVTVPWLTKAIRSVSQQRDVIYVTLGFMLVYCGFLVFTNLLFTNSVVYVWLGITESITMIMTGACFYRFYALGHGMIKNSTEFQTRNKHYFVVLGVVLAFMFIYGMLLLYRKRGQLKYIISLMKLSKVMFLDNWFIIFITLLQIVIVLGVLYFYLNLIYLGLSFGYVDTSTTHPFQQFKPHPIRYLIFPLSLLVFVWTYSICVSATRFLLNCITIEWYFNQKIKGQDYDRIDNLIQSLKLLYIHFGTICYSAILFFIPRYFFKCVNLCKNKITFTSALFDFTISPCCKYLTVYSHTYVILRSYEFNRANRECCSLLDHIRSGTPRLYDLGDYYSRSAIAFFALFSLGFSYYTMLFRVDNSLDSWASILPPIIVIVLSTFLGCTIMINLLGFVGDILVMMHELDVEAQHIPGQRSGGLSAPRELTVVFQEMEDAQM